MPEQMHDPLTDSNGLHTTVKPYIKLALEIHGHTAVTTHPGTQAHIQYHGRGSPQCESVPS